MIVKIVRNDKEFAVKFSYYERIISIIQSLRLQYGVNLISSGLYRLLIILNSSENSDITSLKYQLKT